MPIINQEKDKRAKRFKSWCFTVNNPERSLVAHIFDSHTKLIAYAVWSLEEGESGTPHIQGYVRFTSKRVFNSVKGLLPTGAHVEASNGSAQSNYEYISHTGSHSDKPGLLDGPWELGIRTDRGKQHDMLMFREAVNDVRKFDELYDIDGIENVLAKYPQYAQKMYTLARNKRIKTVEISKLYCWQWGIIRYLERPWETRRIYWIWSECSGTGKSSFGQYLCGKYDVLIASGEYKDILYAYQDQDIIWFDLARADQLNASLTSTLEILSNGGRQMSTKYQACQKIVQAKIVVTSNKAPPRDILPGRLLSIEAQALHCGRDEPHVHGEVMVPDNGEDLSELIIRTPPNSPINYDRVAGFPSWEDGLGPQNDQ